MTYDRVDANQEEIVQALEGIGASIISLASVKYGCPDLLVAYNGKMYLMEVKSEKGKLTPAQVKFHETWRGQVVIIRNAQQAIDVIMDDIED